MRQGVLWRKSSFGTQSERGARYVERVLTACATCRLQKRSVIEYLRDACRCHLDGIAAPSLIKITLIDQNRLNAYKLTKWVISI